MNLHSYWSELLIPHICAYLYTHLHTLFTLTAAYSLNTFISLAAILLILLTYTLLFLQLSIAMLYKTFFSLLKIANYNLPHAAITSLMVRVLPLNRLAIYRMEYKRGGERVGNYTLVCYLLLSYFDISNFSWLMIVVIIGFVCVFMLLLYSRSRSYSLCYYYYYCYSYTYSLHILNRSYSSNTNIICFL